MRIRKPSGKALKWTVEIEIDETVIAEGFTLTENRVRDMLDSGMPAGSENKFTIRIVGRPESSEILAAKGFKTNEEFVQFALDRL